ncbi:winged helix-turn-helix transcriptional regulator [Alteromonas sp. a30]|uniref:winged helix-turn-helix transcriptional regulator n=1 Tax=Alteromonas sp. a30 TaxID=2730917 RepID=UPI00227E3DEC|nr:helix-turn-helix domain-containing protein [Alteromonas sp. a30]MCY7296083.1 helix-turn-helix transcriptional regulator [Alteromonas sp. a30]
MMDAGTKTKIYSCPVEVTIGVIGGKWKSVILYHLISQPVIRFGEFKRILPGVTVQMLTKQLRELESDGVIHREVYQQVPPKVEYSLTKFGKTLVPIVESMTNWGMNYAKSSGKRIELVGKGKG